MGDPQEVENSRERSSEAIERARDALESVDSILQDLPRDTERAHKLPITVSDLNEGVKVSDRQCKFTLPLAPNYFDCCAIAVFAIFGSEPS